MAQAGDMRTAGRVTAAVTALVTFAAVLLAFAAPALANADAVRSRIHARVAVIMDDAVRDGLYSTAQETYVVGAILPSSVDPKDLPPPIERATENAFWDILTETTGYTEGQIRTWLGNGSTLERIAGSEQEALRMDLYRWLSRPVVQAQAEGRIDKDESADLRDDISRAVYRLMGQQGGGDRPVNPIPRQEPVSRLN